MLNESLLFEMDQKFETLNFETVSDILTKKKDEASKHHREFILGLAYVRERRRWTEDTAYKKSSFAEFCKGRFGITEKQVDIYLRLYVHYPKECDKFGASKIMDARRRIGKDRVDSVIKRTNKIQESRKTPIDVTVFDREVKKEATKRQKAKPKAKPTPAPAPVKPTTDYERLQFLEKAHKEDTERIEKLKVALMQRDETIAALRKALNDARNAYNPIIIGNTQALEEVQAQ